MTPPLDITNEKLKGMELLTLINQMVKDTQKVIIRDYPDRIKMTKDQFEDLSKILNMPEMYNTKERIMVTKWNAMEVDVV